MLSKVLGIWIGIIIYIPQEVNKSFTVIIKIKNNTLINPTVVHMQNITCINMKRSSHLEKYYNKFDEVNVNISRNLQIRPIFFLEVNNVNIGCCRSENNLMHLEERGSLKVVQAKPTSKNS